MENNKLRRYLIVAFAVAWILQIAAGILGIRGAAGAYTAILAISMFAPTLGVLAARIPLKEMGFRPTFKGKIPTILAAWLVPGIFAALGALIYFVLFPKAYDSNMSYLSAMSGQNIEEVLAAQGMSPASYAVTMILFSFFAAPWINMFAAIGEEIGWRGYLYKELKTKLSRNKARLLGGIIWGIWHWPIMFFGYEYGVQYAGYPFLGPPVFCMITIALGWFLDEVYERSACIWVPALAHGAINAATWAVMFMRPEYADRLLLGPVPIGLIAGIPYFATALILAYKERESS